MSAHAILSASGAYRWLACPPSAQLERQFPEETSSYAEEGAFAHAFAELRLKRHLGIIKTKAYHKKLEEMQEHSMYSPRLAEYVDIYVTLAAEKISEAKKRSKDAVVLLEQKLDFSQWVPDGFGTGDLVIISDDAIDITDFKYGAGVPVSAEDNPQMKLYGLGAIATYGMLYDFSKVRMTIVQPRRDSLSTSETTVEDLLVWADAYTKPRAELAMAGGGEFLAGDHCKFCRANCTCRARAEANLELAKMDFRDSSLLTDEEIGEVLTKADMLKAWVSDIMDYALDQALNHGKKWLGWKLVSGRSNRKYSDENAAAKVLLTNEYTEDRIYAPRKILGITAMEKEIGRKRFDELLKYLIIRPPGKPTLAPESDKRPEINSTEAAAQDFSEKVKGENEDDSTSTGQSA
ncbi:MAG: DUF2800 domain-containing protein [Eubacteriales bacterium]|jgi:hypothetical protein